MNEKDIVDGSVTVGKDGRPIRMKKTRSPVKSFIKKTSVRKSSNQVGKRASKKNKKSGCGGCSRKKR